MPSDVSTTNLSPHKKRLKKGSFPTSLGMAKHPLPTQCFILMGRKYLFAYPVMHLSLLAFTFMYMNINTLARFGIYSSLMTGNILNAALSLKYGNYHTALFVIVVILCHSFGGTSLSCYLLECYKSREHAFGAIMLLLCISCILVDTLDRNNVTDSNYVVCLLTVICGALAHWSNKLGYVVMFHTGNIFKLSEALWLILNGYTLGSAKARGDAMMLFIMILSSLVGALCADLMLIFLPKASLVPVLATIPLHLHLSGTTAVWGFPLYHLVDYLLGRTVRQTLHNLHLAKEVGAKEGEGGEEAELPECAESLPAEQYAACVSARSSLGKAPDAGEDPKDEEEGGSTRTIVSPIAVSPPSSPGEYDSGRSGRQPFHWFKRLEVTPRDLAKLAAALSSHTHHAQMNMV